MTKAQVSKMHAMKLKRSGPYKVGKRRAAISSNSNKAYPISSNSYSNDEALAIKGNEYVALVVMRTNGNWGYVRFRRDDIDVMDTPTSVIPVHDSHMLVDLWKRIVQHGAIPWTDEVLLDTLRIVKFKQSVTDVTFDLLGDQIDQIIRTNALSKLTDEEADALGVGHEKRKQAIMYDPNFNARDKKLLADLNNTAAIYNLAVEMGELTD